MMKNLRCKKINEKRTLSVQSGFTLIEMILAVGVFSFMMAAVIQSFVLFQGYWVNADREISYQTSGRILLDRIGSDVRNASDVMVVSTSSGVELRVTDLGGTTSAYKFDRTDRAITYDSNLSSGGGEVAMMMNVDELNGENVFEYKGDRMVKITFRAQDPTTADGYQGRDFTTSFYWRNL